MSLTDVINPQVGLGLMLSANRPSWVSLVNLYPKKVTLSLLQRIAWIVNNKYKWEVPLYLKSTWFYQVLWIKYKYKYFAFSPIKYSSTSSTDKIVLKYKYRYLTTTLLAVE